MKAIDNLEIWELAWLERQCRIMGDIKHADEYNAEFKRRERIIDKVIAVSDVAEEPKAPKGAKKTVRKKNKAKKKPTKKSR